MKKKMLSCLLILVFLISTSTSITANNNENNFVNDYNNNLEKEIQALYDQKALLLNNEDTKQAEIDAIDQQLEALGVEFITPELFKLKFPRNGRSQPNVDVPIADNVNWSSYRLEYTYNGQKYELQRLVAQPYPDKDSNLRNDGHKVISPTYNWKAGGMNAFWSAATGSLGEAIPGGGIVVTIYDTIRSFISGASKETTIKNGSDIGYNWASTTTVVFTYVKKFGESDNKQELTYISTKVHTSISWQYHIYSYENPDGSGGGVIPVLIKDDRQFVSIPEGYDSLINAVLAYLNPPYAKSRATVGRIQLTGAETTHLSYIYPADPFFPGQVH